MSCGSCEGPIDWEDDAPEICTACYNQLLEETAKFEPPDDPKLVSLLPDPDTQPIDIYKVTPDTVARIFNAFGAVVARIRDAAPHGPVHDVDVLAAIDIFVRDLVSDTVLKVATTHPTTAAVNRAAITSVLQALIDEIQKLDFPKPEVQ